MMLRDVVVEACQHEDVFGGSVFIIESRCTPSRSSTSVNLYKIVIACLSWFAMIQIEQIRVTTELAVRRLLYLLNIHLKSVSQQVLCRIVAQVLFFNISLQFCGVLHWCLHGLHHGLIKINAYIGYIECNLIPPESPSLLSAARRRYNASARLPMQYENSFYNASGAGLPPHSPQYNHHQQQHQQQTPRSGFQREETYWDYQHAPAATAGNTNQGATQGIYSI